MRQILSIGHSYAVSLNRRLGQEIHHVSQGDWQVTIVSPNEVCGDMRRIPLEPSNTPDVSVVGVSTQWRNRIHLLRYGKDTKAIIQNRRWDLIHIWEEPYIVCGEQLSRWAHHVPHVFFTFQNILKNYPPPFRWFENWSIARSSGWIAAGATVESTLLQKKHYASKNHATIPLGVDMNVFQRSPEARKSTLHKLGWDETSIPALGYLGRFVPEKGLDLIMSVLPRLQGPWRMLFVGGGIYEANLRSFEKKFPDQVRVITGVPHHEVPSFLCAMDVMLAPSQTTPDWREQLGRMLLEAFACHVPVIASDSGEIPNVVGDAGIIVPEQDEIGWTNAIQDLLNSPDRRKRFAESAYSRCREKFDWQVVARQHIHFFERLLATSR